MTDEPSDGRVQLVVEAEDETTWPIERTDVFVSRTRTETWPDAPRKHVRKHEVR